MEKMSIFGKIRKKQDVGKLLKQIEILMQNSKGDRWEMMPKPISFRFPLQKNVQIKYKIKGKSKNTEKVYKNTFLEHPLI